MSNQPYAEKTEESPIMRCGEACRHCIVAPTSILFCGLQEDSRYKIYPHPYNMMEVYEGKNCPLGRVREEVHVPKKIKAKHPKQSQDDLVGTASDRAARKIDVY